MIDWSRVEVVMLDMDGTLLDLHFDNYFWQDYLPECWGKQRGLDKAAAKAILVPKFKSVEGSLAWYCPDYWSKQLDIDILALKINISHLIKMRSYAEVLINSLLERDKRIMLVTNAHPKIVDIKLSKTGIKSYFDLIFSSHNLGVPKESTVFWELLAVNTKFNRDTTMLIDDTSTVLMAAQDYGIRFLLSIAQPDSHLPTRPATDFYHINDFREIFAG